MNKWQLAIQSIGLFLLAIAACFYLNLDRTLAHVPHDDVYKVALSANYSQDRTLYMLVRGNLFKSTNGGDSWQRLVNGIDHHGNLVTFTLATQNNQILYLSSLSDGIYKSEDRGKSWFKVNRGLDNLLIDKLVTSADGKTVLAAGYDKGLYLSSDGGENWQTIIKDNRITALAIHPQKANYLVIGTSQGKIYLSLDSGKTWQEIDAFRRSIIGLVISPDYANDSTIAVINYVGEAYISSDGGKTWQPMYRGLELPSITRKFTPPSIEPRRFFQMAISPNYSEDGTIFASLLWTKFLTYTDRTQRWRISSPPQEARSMAIAVSPNFARDRTIYLAAQKGVIFKSTNGGKSFTTVGKIDRAKGNESPSLVISPNFASDGTLYLTGGKGIYKSIDRGETWQVTTGNSLLQDRFNLKLAISPNYQFDQAKPGSEADRTVMASTDRGLFITDNGGDSWQKLTNPTFDRDAMLTGVAISPNYGKDKTFLISVRGKGLFKTTDNGATFQAVGDNSFNLALLNNFESSSIPIQFSPDYQNDLTIYGIGSADSEIYKSTDGGETWLTITIPQAEIFRQYIDEQYNFKTSLRLFFYVYQSHIFKIIAALVAAAISYFVLGYLNLNKKLSLSKIKLQIIGSLTVLILSAVVLFSCLAIHPTANRRLCT